MQSLVYNLCDIDVTHLIVADDVVDPAYLSIMDNQIDGFVVIFPIQSVPDIEALDINGQ